MPTPHSSSPPGARLQALDILRAVAVLLVLFRHIGSGPSLADLPGAIAAPLRILERGGWAGVDLFFVLSGFLVSSLLFRDYLRHGAIAWKSFLVRRGLKIYPAFYLLMAVTLYLVCEKGHAVPASHLIGELLFLQNYLGFFWNHTWTLAVEEHFYLLLPPALIAYLACHRGEKRPFGRLPGYLLALGGIVLGLRLLTHAWDTGKPFSTFTMVMPTHLRIDSLAFGVLISYFYHFQPEALRRFYLRVRYFLPVVALLCYLPAMLFEIERTPFLYTYGFTLLYMGSGALVLLALYAPPRRGVLARAAAGIGVHSYSIYLWHIFVALSICPRLGRFLPEAHHDAWNILCYLAGSIVLGMALGELVEIPVLKLRDRWFPSPSGTLRRAAPAPSA